MANQCILRDAYYRVKKWMLKLWESEIRGSQHVQDGQLHGQQWFLGKDGAEGIRRVKQEGLYLCLALLIFRVSWFLGNWV